jgi:hypothetical protein
MLKLHSPSAATEWLRSGIQYAFNDDDGKNLLVRTEKSVLADQATLQFTQCGQWPTRHQQRLRGRYTAHSRQIATYLRNQICGAKYSTPSLTARTIIT